MNRLRIVSISIMIAVTTMLMVGCTHQPYGWYGMQGQGMMGEGYYGMHGQGYGMQGQMYNNQRGYEPIPEAKAKKMLNQYIKDNLKGFKLEKLEKQRVPMGIMYIGTLKDSNANEFEIHLNPWGYLEGLLFVKQ